jgi:hypothetical protein
MAACGITTLLMFSLTDDLKVQDQQMLLAERPSDGSMLTLSMRKSMNTRTHASLSFSSVASCTIK